MHTTYTTISPTFKPSHVGDSVGPYGDAYYITFQTVYASTAIVIIIAAIMTWLFTRRLRAMLFRRILRFLLPATLGLATFVIGCAAHFYYGGPYYYENYSVPTKPADVVIWFSGSEDGAYGYRYANTNYQRAEEQFGKDRTALFNFCDIDKALDYASRLPKGSRLIVRGHSMGGASAVRFAQRFKGEILLLDTRDPTSWFGHIDDKPSNVLHWRNILPEDTRLFTAHEDHPTTNHWRSLNMANLFMLLGRPWGTVKGAVNIKLPKADHHECGNNLLEDTLPKDKS